MNSKYINKIGENIKILFLISFVFSFGMFIYYKFAIENIIEEIKYGFISGTIFIGYILVKIILPKIFNFFRKIYNSKRYDILSFIIFGVLFFIYNINGFDKNNYSNFSEKFKNIINKTNQNFDCINCLLIIFILLVIIFSFIKIYNKKENKNKGLLISDKSIKTKKDKDGKLLDKLGISGRAKDFAQTIWNNGSTDSNIFGLIAPWGYGKTSFLNLFEEELEKAKCINNDEQRVETLCGQAEEEFKYKDKYVIFKFNPWYFESEKSLLEKFLNGISSQLSSKYFLPKLDGDLKDLIKFLQDKGNGILGTNFNFSKTESLEDIKENINNSLKELDKKLIIIIDDLDRFTSDKLKVIFKILDLCKGFYNTSYILCYDPNNFNNIENELKETRIEYKYKDNSYNNKYTENEKNNKSISTEKIDNTNLVKYIAKIINIQYPLYPDYEKLKQYFKDLFINDIGLKFSENSIRGIENGIEKLYNIENFGVWGEYISDIRSMKRIANNLIAINSIITKEKKFIYNLFDEQSGGLIFSNFLKLSILSLNFNYLYSDIYNEIKLEGNGKYKYYLTGTKLTKYKFIVGGDNKQLSDVFDNYINDLNLYEKKLIKNIFEIKQNTYMEEYITTHISYQNNLNGYIDILEVNKNAGFNRFIKNQIKEYKTNNIAGIIEEINKKYGKVGNEKFKNDLRLTIGSWENGQEKAFEFIDFILEKDIEIGFIYYEIILYLEQSAGNGDLYSKDKNKEIRDYFYGEGRFSEKKSVIEKLFDDKWGINGVNSLLHLTDYFNERENRIFVDGMGSQEYLNSDPEPSVRTIGEDKSAIARYSREFFKIFKEKYINGGRNIFEEIFKEKYINGGKNIFEEIFGYIEENKNSENIFLYIIHQLTYKIGYYDESNDLYKYDSQNWGIKKELNNYYFEKCFVGHKGLEYFIRYITIHNFIKISRRGNNKIYSEKKLFQIFEKDKLKDFIKNNETEIKNTLDNFGNKKVKIKTQYQDGIFIEKTYQEFWEIFKREFELD